MLTCTCRHTDNQGSCPKFTTTCKAPVQPWNTKVRLSDEIKSINIQSAPRCDQWSILTNKVASGQMFPVRWLVFIHGGPGHMALQVLEVQWIKGEVMLQLYLIETKTILSSCVAYYYQWWKLIEGGLVGKCGTTFRVVGWGGANNSKPIRQLKTYTC